MISIFTVPHLPVENNFLGVVTGMNDQSLAEISRELAPAVNFGDRTAINLIASSPMKRARETVDLCFADDSVTPRIVDDRLNPIDFGAFHADKKNDVRSVRHRYMEVPFPNGESYRQMTNRIDSFVRDMLRLHDGLTMLVIAHESTDAILRYLENPQGSLEDAIIGADKAWLTFAGAKPTQLEMVGKPPEGPFTFA